MIFLAQVTHENINNTLEALWVEKVFAADGVTVLEFIPVRRHNFSPGQKDEFIADCGDAGQKYVTMAGW
jgi:hypothetical protein